MKGRRILFFFSLIISLSFVHCDSPVAIQKNIKGLERLNNGKYRGGTLRLNEGDMVENLLPLKIQMLVEKRISSQIYQGLTRLDPNDLSVKPCLATRWVVSADGLEYTFYLREDVVFYARNKTIQEPFTAHHVEKCIKKLCLIPSDDPLRYLVEDLILGSEEYALQDDMEEPLKGVQVLNDHTLKIRLNYPNVSFLEILTHQAFWVYQMTDLDEETEMLPGTGAFYLEERTGEFALLLRNEHYWEKDEDGNRLPYLGRVKISFERDKTKELNAFKEEKLDVIYRLPLHQIDEAVLDLSEVIEQDGNIHYDLLIAPAMVTQYYGFDTKCKAFEDVRVRKAFNYAIDRDVIARYALQGDVRPGIHGIVPPGLKQYDASIVHGFDFDVLRAKELLTQAGYPDGKGFPEAVLYVNSNNQRISLVASQVVAMIKENLKISIKVAERSNIQMEKAIRTREASLWRSGWSADYPSAENFLKLFISPLGGKSNESNYSNTLFDSLYLKGVSTVDADVQQECFLKADQLLIEDAVIMPLYYDEITLLKHRRVKGFPINAMDLRDLSRVYVNRKAAAF